MDPAMKAAYEAKALRDMDRDHQLKLSEGLESLAYREQYAREKREADVKAQTQATALGGTK
jgi:hypothetical protein